MLRPSKFGVSISCTDSGSCLQYYFDVVLAEWENRTDYIVPFDAEKRVNESQVTKDKAKFQKSNQVTMQVLSASDYEIVLSHAGRAGDSRKLKKNKNEPGFDLQTAPQIITKPYMKQMMKWLFVYFEAKHPNQYNY